MKKLLLLATVLTALISGCAEKVSKTYETGPITFELSGPLFMGPNTAQAVLEPDFSAMGLGDLTADQIHEVKLVSATFTSSDSIPFQNWDGSVLQFVTDNADMVNAAVMNPLEANGNSITLTGSAEADLSALFKDLPVYVVTDINLSEDVMGDLTFTGDLTFEMLVSEK